MRLCLKMLVYHILTHHERAPRTQKTLAHDPHATRSLITPVQQAHASIFKYALFQITNF